MKTEAEIKTELTEHEASAGQLVQDIAQLEAQMNEMGNLLMQKRGQKHIHEIAIMAYRNVLSPSAVPEAPGTGNDAPVPVPETENNIPEGITDAGAE